MGSSRAFWYLENRVVYVHNVGDLTADDFRGVDKQIIALMNTAQEQGAEKVYVLVDCVALDGLPAFNELEGGRILKYLKHPICSTTIIVDTNQNLFLKVLSRFLTTIAGTNIKFANSLEEGADLIQRMGAIESLPDVSTWASHH